ncbi:MAG: ATP-dependent nuclease subunit B-like protein, partial [Verrucomicrobia bacterium]|nr:ATP-dependent nuclease subunit B-like protein [Verrucomicrobiota bacterium]
MPTSRHFLAWDRPLLPQAVEFLTRDWKGRGPLDLASVLVVVPTRQSGRRLREALALHASNHDAAVFPPRVMLPESLLTAARSPTNVASRLESQVAWIDVFRDLDLEKFRVVFPMDPPSRNFAWARRLAQEFSRLQSTLAEAGLKLADVTAKAGEDFPEAERWDQITQLEQLQAARLAELGRVDAQAAKIDRASAPSLPENIRRVVVIGTPDPLPLAIEVLRKHADAFPVEVVVFAPEDESLAFDEWGRPTELVWEKRILDLPQLEARVTLAADPEDQADRIKDVVRRYEQPEGLLAVGSADPDVLPLLENALAHVGTKTFNPVGRPRRNDRLYQLLAALAGLAREASFAAVEILARCPDFLEFLRARGNGNFSAADFLGQLSQLRTDHLPPDLTEA